MKITQWFLQLILSVILINHVAAQNPLITDQFTADPSARVFNGRVYIYPSHDILATPGHGRPGWFCMEDYHVFSSANLTEWTDHGMILHQRNVPWADTSAYSMWAPDCIYRSGKYYFYFPTNATGGSNGKGFTVGVAIGQKPSGPFVPQPEPIKGIHGIDPNVFIDKDGQAYLYWAQGNIFGARLKDNMTELASEPKILGELPDKGLKEGPYLFERNGIYYLTYPHVANKTERLEYATASNPLGPFKFAGVIMDEAANGCWTNHQSIINFKGQWYLFYHQNDLSPNFDKNRSIRADSLFFNADGTIRKVIPTLRGVGLSAASKKIQTDRYSDISKTGAGIAYLDTAHKMQGWKAIFNERNTWLRYNSVDFAKGGFKTVQMFTSSADGAVIEIRADKIDGRLISKINIAANSGWKLVNTRLNYSPSRVHHLFIILKTSGTAEVDYIRFN